MKIYIVRHGQVPHNALKMYSNENEDLNEIGIKQAEDLKNRIENLNFDNIISSEYYSPLFNVLKDNNTFTFSVEFAGNYEVVSNGTHYLVIDQSSNNYQTINYDGNIELLVLISGSTVYNSVEFSAFDMFASQLSTSEGISLVDGRYIWNLKDNTNKYMQKNRNGFPSKICFR